MKLKEFVEITFATNAKDGFCFRPRIICNDGFSMSVQGGYGLYCMPRVTQSTYIQMEIGYPSREEVLINEYAEMPDTPTETVYPYVPCAIIEQVIEKHGGINITETFTKK